MKQAGLEEETGTECYFYYPVLAATGFAPRSMNIVLRSSSPPEGVSATDLATFVTVPVVLLTCGALRLCRSPTGPAYRLTRVEPVTALRYE